jgi:O-antigen ligase
MLIASSSLLFVLMNKKKWILYIFGIVILVLSISSKYSNIENINLFRTVSSEARLETAGNAVKIIQDHPIFGVGFNAYRYAQLRYGFRNSKANIISHADASPDNSFLFIMATSGLVGFAFFILLWLRLLKYNIKNNPFLLSSVIGIFINGLFINSLFYPFIMIWLWIVIAVKESN